MNQKTHHFDYLTGQKYISLTTFYKSGRGVATPVEFARKGDKLYISTEETSYKVKRIINNANANIAPCSFRGKIKGPEIKVKVRILSVYEQKIAIDAIDELYQGLAYKIVFFLSKAAFWRKKVKRVYLEII